MADKSLHLLLAVALPVFIYPREEKGHIFHALKQILGSLTCSYISAA